MSAPALRAPTPRILAVRRPLVRPTDDPRPLVGVMRSRIDAAHRCARLVLVVLCLAQVWLRLQVVNVGYELSAARKLLQRLDHEERELRAELAILQDASALAEAARPRPASSSPARVRWSSSDDGAARPSLARRRHRSPPGQRVRGVARSRRRSDRPARSASSRAGRPGSTGGRSRSLPHRGEIVDRNGELLALSLNVPSVYVRPRQLGDNAAVSPTWRARSASPPRVCRSRSGDAALRLAEAPGAAAGAVRRARPAAARAWGTSRSRAASTPMRSLAAHMLGFVGTDAQGLAGLELRFDRRDPWPGAYASPSIATLAAASSSARAGTEPPTDGSRVAAHHRRRDPGADRARAGGRRRQRARPWRARRSCSIRRPVSSWRSPTIPPSIRTTAPTGATREQKQRIRNRAISDPYEPGSTFKAILAASALEEGVVKPTERIFCENGDWKIGKWDIHDSHPHGWLSFAEVIQFSSNIGAAKVGDRLGRERYHDVAEEVRLRAAHRHRAAGRVPGHPARRQVLGAHRAGDATASVRASR